MRILFHLLVLFSIISCSNYSRLNNRIYKAQKEERLQSPFKSAKYGVKTAKIQKYIRSKEHFDQLKLFSLKNPNLSDTLILIERFSKLCTGCPSEYSEILFQDTVFSISSDYDFKIKKYNYIIFKEKYSNIDNLGESDFKYSNLFEFRNKIRLGKSWKSNPLSFGSEDCMGGSVTQITVVYPSKKVESLYVNCLDLNFDSNWLKK